MNTREEGNIYKGREEVYTREERKCIQEMRESVYKGREEVYTREERKYVQGNEEVYTRD